MKSCITFFLLKGSKERILLGNKISFSILLLYLLRISIYDLSHGVAELGIKPCYSL